MNLSKQKDHISRTLLLSVCIVQLVILQVTGLPQWVWNKDVIDSSRIGNSQSDFAGHSTRFPSSSEPDPPKSNIRVVDGSPRLIPTAINAISNSIQGSSGGNSGGFGGVFGALFQTIPQLATQAISGIFNRPISLPAGLPGSKDPSNGSGSGSGGGSSFNPPATGGSSGSCKCVSSNECFLPFQQTGSCEGGRVRCCSSSGTRTIFQDENGSSSSGTKNTKGERTVTQRELRRGLLQNILKGGGSIVDDTLDLILAPYLTTEDQQRLATRVITE